MGNKKNINPIKPRGIRIEVTENGILTSNVRMPYFIVKMGLKFGQMADHSKKKGNAEDELMRLKALIIEDVDFTRLRNGTYVGEYAGTNGNSRNATVEVTISGGKITKITILKGALDSDGNSVALTGGMTIDGLFQKVLESESLQVDAISGATITSKAHLKALENALKQAGQ